MKAAGPPTACASMPATGSDAPTLKSHHDAAVLTRGVPLELAKAARDVGWRRVERTWCTLLALAACEIYELGWVVNPWDESFEPYDIAQHGWTFVQKNLAGTSPEMADAVLRGRNAAKIAVTAWRESHSDAIEGLRERRIAEAAEKKKDEKKNASDRRRRPRGDLVLAHASDALRARGVGVLEVHRTRVLRSAHVLQGVSRAGDGAIYGRAAPLRAVVHLPHGTAHLRVDVFEPRDAVLRRRARSARVHAEHHGRVHKRRSRGRVRRVDARDETVAPAEVEVRRVPGERQPPAHVRGDRDSGAFVAKVCFSPIARFQHLIDRVGPFQLTDELYLYGTACTGDHDRSRRVSS